jgi:hypothetical protein
MAYRSASRRRCQPSAKRVCDGRRDKSERREPTDNFDRQFHHTARDPPVVWELKEPVAKKESASPAGLALIAAERTNRRWERTPGEVLTHLHQRRARRGYLRSRITSSIRAARRTMMPIAACQSMPKPCVFLIQQSTPQVATAGVVHASPMTWALCVFGL